MTKIRKKSIIIAIIALLLSLGAFYVPSLARYLSQSKPIASLTIAKPELEIASTTALTGLKIDRDGQEIDFTVKNFKSSKTDVALFYQIQLNAADGSEIDLDDLDVKLERGSTELTLDANNHAPIEEFGTTSNTTVNYTLTLKNESLDTTDKEISIDIHAKAEQKTSDTATTLTYEAPATPTP